MASTVAAFMREAWKEHKREDDGGKENRGLADTNPYQINLRRPTRVFGYSDFTGAIVISWLYRIMIAFEEEAVLSMVNKTFIPEGEAAPASQIGATLEALASTIAARRNAGEESYTHRLLTGDLDKPLKKVAEEAVEVGLAAKDVESWATSSIAAALAADACAGKDAAGAGVITGSDAGEGLTDTKAETLSVALPAEYHAAVDHLRYEAADVVYHLLVVLERFGISIDEFAAELNNRMTDEERPEGAIRLFEEHVRRGK